MILLYSFRITICGKRSQRTRPDSITVYQINRSFIKVVLAKLGKPPCNNSVLQPRSLQLASENPESGQSYPRWRFFKRRL